MVLLAICHLAFPRYFRWKQDLAAISQINREMMYVHTYFIALTVLLMGLLCFSEANALITTSLGKSISMGFALFWGSRLLVQFFGYSSNLWKGKGFETAIHIAFTVLWGYFTGLFILISKG